MRSIASLRYFVFRFDFRFRSPPSFESIELRPLGLGMRTRLSCMRRQYFSRLDAPRGQLRNQFPIRGQKIVITQLLGQNPRNLFKRLRNYLRRRNRCRVETNFQFLRRFCVLVPHAPQFHALHQFRSQFLAQLPRQRGFGFFAVPDLAAGKLPFERGGVVLPALTDQQPTIAPFNDRRHHDSHLSATLCALCVICSSSVISVIQALCTLRYLFSSSFFVARECKIFHNSIAPRTSGGPGVFSNSSLITCTRFSRIAGTSCHAGIP